ncbi:DUF1349 domain-containing protein [Agromyces fucosus]|uniref:DUF1349 domain-containing protein n=1 Tax=Agromyces fucosus TaxID=41985 RepID=A0A4Q2JQP3_9MICO|nr:MULTISPECIES: DUF1349 domain-containing protein [Agromyces]KQZ08125.1 hypothetical protein ASD23_06525 [Agromyces sp. Root1464]RXZ50382.1 DUF1349 domain-containing protein [Agromyces fucosus]
MQIPGLPALQWTNAASVAAYHPGAGDAASAGELVMRAAPGVDWSNDSLGGPGQHGASLLGFTPEGDFTLSARTRVVSERTTFDAAVLGLWCDEDHWAKLCFEYSPGGQAMVVSVVTNDYSDDCNSSIVEEEFVHLRVSRIGEAYAFHASTDGERWDFVRLFRLHTDVTPVVGFMSQAPLGETCEARFDQIRLTDETLLDLREGS